jgi:ABC-type proline/glycine betaine transport system permease subunit
VRRSHRAILSLLVGTGYAVTSAIGGHLVAGLVGGALAVILLYVAIDRFEQQHAANRRRRQKR